VIKLLTHLNIYLIIYIYIKYTCIYFCFENEVDKTRQISSRFPFYTDIFSDVRALTFIKALLGKLTPFNCLL